MSAQVVFICGVYGTIETVFQVGLSLFVLLSTYCQTQLPEWNRFFYLVNIMYLSNADCKREYRVGLVEDSLPNGATIILSDTPFTADRTKIFAFIYGILGIFGFFSSIQLLVKAKCSSDVKEVPSAFIRGFWGLIMVLTSFTDIVSSSIYLLDIPKTWTLSTLVNTIGATASGFQGNSIDGTWSAATAFTIYFSRLLGFWLFRVVFLWRIILLVKTKVEDNVTLEQLERQPEIYQNPPPVRYVFKRTSSLPQIRAPPNLRKYPEPRMLAPLYNTEDYAINRLSKSEPCLDVIPTPDPDKKKIKLKFPTSLLSLPQRLEQIMREREKKVKPDVETADIDDTELLDVENFTFGNGIQNNDPLQVWKEPEVTKASRPRRLTDTDIRLLSYKEETYPALRGVKPWSYTPQLAGGHRMRDHLPPDEELPPVPVPDYTLHRRRPSLVHMTSAYPDPVLVRNSGKRESSVSANDVLY